MLGHHRIYRCHRAASVSMSQFLSFCLLLHLPPLTYYRRASASRSVVFYLKDKVTRTMMVPVFLRFFLCQQQHFLILRSSRILPAFRNTKTCFYLCTTSTSTTTEEGVEAEAAVNGCSVGHYYHHHHHIHDSSLQYRRSSNHCFPSSSF